MRLSARLLASVSGVNAFRYAQDVQASVGDPLTLYLQLVDLEQLPTREGYEPGGLRYLPVAGATVNVTFRNLDGSKQFTRAASQPFVTDTSIWSVGLLATDPARGTVDLKVTLTESGAGRTFTLPAALLLDDGIGLA